MLAATIIIRPAAGQERIMVAAPSAQPMSPEQAKAMAEAQAKAAGQPGQPATPGAEPPKEGEKKEGEGEKKDAPADSVKRPEKPPRPPDPRDFEVVVKDGRVPPFNFIGQPWPDVMQWLATQSKASFDYQELPNDYVNLTTQRSYTIDEVRDLINGLLHARGYTAIQSGEMLRAFKIEKLDPSVVPRVTEDELYDLRPYDFVKVSFELPANVEVEKAKEDVKQVLSPQAKVFPLVTTKRLLLMDAVANLRLVSALLNEERSMQDSRVVPKEFVLKHARPEKVIDILYVVLGMDPQSRPTQMELQLQQQKLQLMTQMQQQGKDVASMLKKDGPPVYLAYNKQRNSVIANAPPEQMKIIEQTIKYLDVPFGDTDSVAGISDAGSSGGAGSNGERTTKKYPLTTLDPDNFVLTLEEIGGLSPSTEFRADKKSKMLFAIATEADHAKITSLIDQFDGSGRDFHVIWLRRLPADAVAATVYNLMAGQQEEEDSNSRRRPYWYYDPWDEQEDEDKPVKGFGVEADVENNRLLLWATEAEMERVKGLLVKLGEIPGGQRDPRPVRFIQPGDEAATAELLERLRDAWSAAGKNELIIKVPQKKADASNEDQKEEQGADAVKEVPTQPSKDRSARLRPAGQVLAQFVQLEAEAVDPLHQGLDKLDTTATNDSAENPVENGTQSDETDSSATANDNQEAATSAPVTITVTEDGRLMLTSPDTAALDQVEELIEQLTPPERRFQVFPLKHIPAVHMYLDLKDFFEEDLKSEGGNDFADWFWGFPSSDKEEGPRGLGKRRKLMITYDEPSNSILVANASPSQLAEIEQLVTVFDKPKPTDSMEVRDTKPVKIRFSKASVIAATVKEVYRDLLSTRDKEFDGGDQRQQRANAERVTVFNYGGSSSSNSNRRSSVKASFEGALSIGADDVSNVIIVSAQRGIFEDVVKMIEELDQEAAPTTVVRVHRINGNVSARALQDTLEDAVGQAWFGGKPEQQAGDRGDGDGRDRERGRRDRWRRDRRGDGDGDGRRGNGGGGND
jgi:type II secretory pathway component GspD/PulD (secretin)